MENEPYSTDYQLNCRITQQRLAHAVRVLADEQRTCGHAAEENRQYDDLCIRAVADEEAQIPAPDRLVDEPRPTGNHEDHDEQREHAARIGGGISVPSVSHVLRVRILRERAIQTSLGCNRI